jgi:mRNA interferase RelE/StbE
MHPADRPSYRVEFIRAARRDLARLPPRAQESVSRAVNALSGDPRPSGARMLQGGERSLRIRIGDYRVVYWIDDATRTVTIEEIGDRKDIYRHGRR